ncbi:archease [Nocardia aurantiaca]|uniref:Archease n=1 Tax=Nocardia aurantiaca TaxID=2675850 RepID=A0A6I3KZA1_9NOCA|nr:archease [Nocardia aurantiaca]MTE13574.1 archease [Nocardia aurantiaca]
MTEPTAGYRYIPHPADLCVEAWAPTQKQCLVQVVDALVDSFIERPRPRASEAIEWVLPDDQTENLLGTLLEEVIYQLEVHSRIPVATAIEREENGWRVRFEMADLDQATPCGAVPKAVSLHGMRLRPEGNRWRCVVTIDV